MPYAACIGAIPRPSPSTKRPPDSACIVSAKPAVTIGWRVLWFVTAVPIRIDSVTAAAAPQREAASFWL